MKNLEVTQDRDSPQLSPSSLGIAMDEDSCLAMGIVSEDGGYFVPGKNGMIGGTVAGGVSGDAGG
jgi:hypothetical protein